MAKHRPAYDLIDLIQEQWDREFPGLDASSIAVLGRLHRCDIKYQLLVSESLAEFDLSTAAFDVLASLRRSGPTYRRTAGELAQIGLITTGGLTQRIDRLEKAGLVERVKGPGDRRLVYIQLTAAGRALIDEVIQVHFSRQRKMLDGLTSTEQRQLARLLGRLEQSLEAAEIHQAVEADEADD
jgi:DNA-binding MarR family transcriptional regulator